MSKIIITSKSEINMFPYDNVKQKHKIITNNKEIVIVYKDVTIDDKITINPNTNIKGFSLMISLSAIDYKDYNYDNDTNVVTIQTANAIITIKNKDNDNKLKLDKELAYNSKTEEYSYII